MFEKLVEMPKYHGLVMNVSVSIHIHSLKTNMAPARKPPKRKLIFTLLWPCG